MGSCSVSSCDRKRQAKGYCLMHYRRWRRTGDATKTVRMKTAEEPCRADGCEDRQKYGQGYCTKHYARWKRHGDANKTVRRAAYSFDRYVDSNGYVLVRDREHPNAQSNGFVREHVQVMAEVLGRPLVKGENVHHKNGEKQDNRPDNLELWVRLQPTGQRVEDLVDYAREILHRYA